MPAGCPALHGRKRLISQRQHAPGVIEQHLAGRGQLQALALTTEQFDPQLFFQLAQAGGKVRRHAVQALRCAGYRPLFGDCLEDTQLTELHELFSITEQVTHNYSILLKVNHP